MKKEKSKMSIFRVIFYVFFISVSVLYALPNFYDKDPAVVIVSKLDENKDANGVISKIKDNKENINYKDAYIKEDSVIVTFNSISSQMKGYEHISDIINDDFYKNLNLISTQPLFLDYIKAKPANLGLDLRGGVHFLMEVDSDNVIVDSVERYRKIIKNSKHIKESKTVSNGDSFVITNASDDLKIEINKNYLQIFDVVEKEKDLQLKIRNDYKRQIVDLSVKQNILTLQNRVNEIGVAEPTIQRQGFNRIIVQLPGIQDTQKAKEIIGTTATLEFRAIKDDFIDNDDSETIDGLKAGEKFVFFKDEIVSGKSIVDASSGFDPQSNSPLVSVTLDSEGGSKMFDYTSKNKGKMMGSILISTTFTRDTDENGETVKTKHIKKTAINVARIQGAFSNRFQITGLDSKEGSHKLAILLRSGALAAPVEIVEERTIGPNIGADNIKKGQKSVIIGFLLVLVLMFLRYRTLGMIANVCVFINMMLLLSMLSFIGATLTLPGIAGIILTVGMAVDANIVIFERIKEEFKKTKKLKKSIESGYKKAFSSIVDANITTFIAGTILFVFGTGAIKGFAVTLSIGILTSLITSIYLSRFLVDVVYKNKKELNL